MTRVEYGDNVGWGYDTFGVPRSGSSHRRRDREFRAQLLQLRFELAVSLVILFRAVTHDQDMRDPFLEHHGSSPGTGDGLRSNERVGEDGLDGLQPSYGLRRRQLVGVHPDGRGRRTTGVI